jgi:hypothetical protein
VQCAIADLRGSVTVDGLPEMASRLVRHRLRTGNTLRMRQPRQGLVLPEHAALVTCGAVPETLAASASGRVPADDPRR